MNTKTEDDILIATPLGANNGNNVRAELRIVASSTLDQRTVNQQGDIGQKQIPDVGSDWFEQIRINNEENIQKLLLNPNKNKPKSSKSKIQYDGNGIFTINLNSLNNPTRYYYNITNQNPDNWPYNSQTGQKEIGISLKIGEIQLRNTSTVPNDLPTMDNTYGATNPAYDPTNHKVQTPVSKSTGQPDKRYAQRSVSGSAGAATRGGAVLTLALDVFFIVCDLWGAYAVNQDLEAIEKQKMLLQKATGVVQNGIQNGLVPSQYQNTNDIGAITNFVFQGVNNTGNTDISRIGTDILNSNKNGKNFKKGIPLLEQ